MKGNNSQIGVAKSYKVYAGDKVKIEAWAKYQNPTSTSSNLSGFATALLAAFGLPAPAGGETGTASAALNNWGGLVVGGNGGGSSGPKAFVNIIVFDKNYKLLDAAWEAVDPAANQVGATPVVPHDYVMREYTAKEEGYMFVYVSNENATLVDVYFDDVVMTHTKGNVIQYNEYYPFGLQTATSWTRENTTGNNFLANSATELNTTSNYYDLDYRNYDPILGRMNGIDPVATKYASLTPYNFSFNDPVTFTDPTGADPDNPGDWDFAGSYLDAMNYGWSPGMAPMTVMDPGMGGMSSTWSPMSAGGYGVAGAGLTREFGMSMSFGALPYSAVGRNQLEQMKEDAQNQMSYTRKYGVEYVKKPIYKRVVEGYKINNASLTRTGGYVYNKIVGYEWKKKSSASKSGDLFFRIDVIDIGDISNILNGMNSLGGSRFDNPRIDIQEQIEFSLSSGYLNYIKSYDDRIFTEPPRFEVKYYRESNTISGFIGDSSFTIAIRKNGLQHEFITTMHNSQFGFFGNIKREWAIRVIVSSDRSIDITRDAIIGAKPAGVSSITQYIISNFLGPTNLGTLSLIAK